MEDEEDEDAHDDEDPDMYNQSKQHFTFHHSRERPKIGIGLILRFSALVNSTLAHFRRSRLLRLRFVHGRRLKCELTLMCDVISEVVSSHVVLMLFLAVCIVQLLVILRLVWKNSSEKNAR